MNTKAPSSLEERIVSVLTTACTSADAETVRVTAERALADMQAEAAAAETASLSPLATSTAATELRQRASQLRFEADRIEVSASALATRVAELRKAEQEAVNDAERRAAVAERDALAAEIAEKYPRIVRTLTELRGRIDASDARCGRLGVTRSAESIGRGVPTNFFCDDGWVPRIADIRLPMPASSRMAWGADGMGGMFAHGLTLDVEPF